MPRTVKLVYRNGDPAWVRWQVAALEPWIDAVTGEITDYLAGFETQDAAKRYCRLRGYKIVKA